MKIAVPVRNTNQIDEHFGHCEKYQIFSISESKEIVEVEEIASPQGCGCKSNIASVLSQKGVSVFLVGGIGAGAINVLNSVGIDVVRGCSGNARELVMQFVNGNIADSGESCRQHEHHHGSGHEHSCGH